MDYVCRSFFKSNMLSMFLVAMVDVLSYSIEFGPGLREMKVARYASRRR
jgi:hypothetical protein